MFVGRFRSQRYAAEAVTRSRLHAGVFSSVLATRECRTTGACLRAVVIGVFFALTPLSIEAANFFVATTGSDTAGNGSSATPWRTIGHAVRNVPDGSTILVRAGTYTGRIDLVGNFATG